MERVDYESMVIQELLGSYDRGELELSPWYQRRAVWSNSHKSYLINSIFAAMPVPTLYIRHTINMDEKATKKEVVDGQQRIRAIIGFRTGEFSSRHPEHSGRVHFDDLSRSQREDFLMTKLSIGYLVGATDSDVIEIFGRLNAVSKTLNAEEKRAAKFSGEFHQFCLNQASIRLPIWRGLNLFTANDISRMNEVQFVAELSMGLIGGLQDYSSAKVDTAYRSWDDEFEMSDDVRRRFDRVFNLVAESNPESFRNTIFSRSPVFYSLFLILDSLDRLPRVNQLEPILYLIDARFNDDRPISDRPEEDIEFIAACTSNTHRIKARTTRDQYIRMFFK